MRGMRPKMESCNFTRTSFKSALFNALGIFAFWYREMGSGFGLSMSLPLPCYAREDNRGHRYAHLSPSPLLTLPVSVVSGGPYKTRTEKELRSKETNLSNDVKLPSKFSRLFPPRLVLSNRGPSMGPSFLRPPTSYSTRLRCRNGQK